MKNPTFWIRLFISGSIFLLAANRLQAQGAGPSRGDRTHFPYLSIEHPFAR